MNAARLNNSERIRISCLALARIRHPDNQTLYSVMVNPNYEKQRRLRLYTPVGGKLWVTPKGKADLPPSVAFETKEGSKDLRLTLAAEHLGDFIEWFKKRDHRLRETDVKRELQEELGPKEGGPLTARQVQNARTRFVGVWWEVMNSLKPGVVPRETLYIGEVFDIRLQSDAIHALATAGRDPTSNFIFVSKPEIRQGHTFPPHQYRIGRTALALLDPRPIERLSGDYASLKRSS